MAAETQSLSAGLRDTKDRDPTGSEGTPDGGGPKQAAPSKAATSYSGPPPRLPKGQYTNEEIDNAVQPVGYFARDTVGDGGSTTRVAEAKPYAPSPVGNPNSGEKGSGARYNAGKPPLEMVPLHLLDGAARVFHAATTRAVNPYPKWNWAKGMAWSVPYACLLRHMAAWYRGEEIDADTGESHLALAMCNLLMLTHYQEQYKEGDDRPNAFKVP